MTDGAKVRDLEVVDLVQQLIRNACVNDGTDESGHEDANVDVLRSSLEGSGCDLESYEPLPGRVSLVARIEGVTPPLRLCVTSATPMSCR